MASDDEKQRAAAAALAYVEPGMKLGLGTGSTASRFVDLLGAKVAAGLKVIGVPTSEATRAQAQRLGIPLTTLDETPELDLTIDGADEIDGELRLIKGGGGALLREKIVAASSRAMLVIVDASKKVARLGAFALPIEVVPFGLGLDAGAHRTRLRRSRPHRRDRLAAARRARRSSPTAATTSSTARSARSPIPSGSPRIWSFPAWSSTGCFWASRPSPSSRGRGRSRPCGAERAAI